MLELLKKLCEIPAVSGNESLLREFILNEISCYADCKTDNLGSIIAFKKGAKQPKNKVVLDAHLDEVGLIITGFNDNGTLTFDTVGGINTEALIARRVIIGDHYGVISNKPIHLLKKDELNKLPDKDSLVIDIGAADKDEAMKYVGYGDTAFFDSEFVQFGNKRIKARALDDRVGCAILISLIKEDLPYDMYFTFSVQEEVGLRGARATSYSVEPDFAIVVEATTAADIADVSKPKQVCALGSGAVVSFMDGATLYERALYNAAFKIAKENDIKIQSKAATAGGNDAGAIHLSRKGVRTIALSVPCRYLHTAACVIDNDDFMSTLDLTREMAINFAAGMI